MNGRMVRNIRHHISTASFLGPWFLCFLAFTAYPVGYSLYLSFHKYSATGVKPPEWVGLQNFISLLSDERFLRALWNSFYFAMGSVPVTIVLAIVMAVMLNRSIRMRAFYRVAVFMPVVTSLFVTATIFAQLYSPRGLINDLIGLLGAEPIHWLRDTTWAMPAIIFMAIWSSFGFYSMVILAGLQSIPREYYELAELEGTPKLRSFFTITLPLIKPTVLFAMVLNFVLAFQAFGEIYIMTKGGPLGATETAVYYLYEMGFSRREMGYASAAAYIIFAVLAVFSILQIRLMKSRSITNI